jgi:hypothetical protein
MMALVVALKVVFASLRLDPPKWVSAKPMWGEAKGRHKFHLDGNVITQTVDILVSQLVLSWGWADGHPPHFLEIDFPSIPIPGTKGTDLRGGHQGHYFTRPFGV